MHRFTFTRPALRKRRAATWAGGPCVAPEAVDRSPLLTELVALGEHAARLEWLSSREQHPDAYRQLAADAIGMLLEGWRAQRTGEAIGQPPAMDLLAELMPAGSESRTKLPR